MIARSAADRLRWLNVLADRPYAILTGAQSALAFAWLLPGTILPVYIVRFLGLPKWIPSALLCLNFLIVMTLQVRVTAQAAKYRRTVVVGAASGVLAAAVGFFALSWGASPIGAVVTIVAGVLCFSFGEMLWNPTASALAAEAAPADARGRYIAFFQMSWAVSNTAGPVLVGTLLSAGPGWLWMSLGAIIVLGGVGFLLSGRLLPPAVNRVA
jgi:MFS family permease